MELTWADRINALEARGWSVSGIARSIGKSPQTLSEIKHGRSNEPCGMAAVQLHHLHTTGAMPPLDRTEYRTPALMDTTWADRIKALEAREWSLTDIAHAMGKTLQTVSEIKHGRTREPGGMAAVQLHFLYSTGAKPPITR